MIEDRKNQIWFGGEQGEVMIYKNNKFYQLQQFDRLIEEQITKIYEDAKGNIWIGTQADGVIKVNDGVATHYKKQNGLISNEISDIKLLLINSYLIILLLSTLCWFIDQFYCEKVQEYFLHAWWHIGTGISIFLGLLFLVI